MTTRHRPRKNAEPGTFGTVDTARRAAGTAQGTSALTAAATKRPTLFQTQRRMRGLAVAAAGRDHRKAWRPPGAEQEPRPRN